MTIDGSTTSLRYGYIVHDLGGAKFVIVGAAADCSTSYPQLQMPPATLFFVVPPGPGGHYYAGHAFGVSAVVTDPSRRISSGVAMMGDAPLTVILGAPAISVRLEPSSWKAGAHVRGSIHGVDSMGHIAAQVDGTFDLTICDDLPTTGDRGVLPEAAPASAATGEIDGKAVSAGTVQAVVVQRSKYDAFGDVIQLAFYRAAHVPCAQYDGRTPAAESPFFRIELIGGAGEDRPQTGTTQPAYGTAFDGAREIDGTWNAWVRFDHLSWEPGGELNGEFVAQSSLPEDRGGGHIGGRFEATVCRRARE